MIGVGVDIGGTFVKLFVMNEHGEIFRKEKWKPIIPKAPKGLSPKSAIISTPSSANFRISA